ncbi:mono-functional DNA-alkylating methyl methanesulfonate N-term-domain-containing protein [Jimgerdemannia flammicorona]|uniref:Mono-functional DNA-alkylating methyl methanesulfonate N-term-domain-containing protein n=1 Tax=Jimgerdemannia flammicorona TaxID=994334 RepID=A0A433QGW0_9FUNG|nr:mono-functional DNA-alkylating methyl methanesulfonate N-term-domain-containing protein [Jimgerdemannia flammicorona]
MHRPFSYPSPLDGHHNGSHSACPDPVPSPSPPSRTALRSCCSTRASRERGLSLSRRYVCSSDRRLHTCTGATTTEWQSASGLFEPYLYPTSDFLQRYDFTQEGIIWQASFLYPNPMKQERVLLAIMVFKLVSTPWFSYVSVLGAFVKRVTLTSNISFGSRPVCLVMADSPLPLHIVPLPRYPECFLIINEREACFIRTEEAASGLTHFPKFPLPTLTREFGDVDGVQYPHITATALPIDQEPSVADTTQRLYAGTSGGLVYCIDVAEGPSVEFGLLGKRNPVGAAMCVVASGPGFVGEEELEAQAEDGEEDEERGDVIVYAGEMADGEVVLARPTRLHLSTLQTITNHAPVLDFAVLDPRGERCDSVFTCSGRGPRHGTVREVRNGIGVVVLHRSEPECDGVTGLWSLRNRPAENWDEFLVVSFASETRVMNIGAGDLDDITDTSGFDAHASTLAAATLAAGEYDVARGGYLLQVHGGGVVVARPAVARAEDPDEG